MLEACRREGPLGKEMSVIAMGAFGDDNIFPVLAAPTCKCEDSEKMITIFTLVRLLEGDWS